MSVLLKPFFLRCVFPLTDKTQLHARLHRKRQSWTSCRQDGDGHEAGETSFDHIFRSIQKSCRPQRKPKHSRRLLLQEKLVDAANSKRT